MQMLAGNHLQTPELTFSVVRAQGLPAFNSTNSSTGQSKSKGRPSFTCLRIPPNELSKFGDMRACDWFGVGDAFCFLLPGSTQTGTLM